MTGREQYPHVFEPFDLAGVRLRNRVFVPAHTLNLAEQFLPSERNAAYLAERAKGGAALIFTEGIRVHPTSVGRAAALIGYDERALPGYRRMAEGVHEQGAALFAQILHQGRNSDNIFLRTASWGPSAIPHATGAPVPHVMTVREIHETTAAFVFTAQLLREAGFRGLEISLGHGHLLHQFLSPLSNIRDDEYGGSAENRLRFPLEVVRAVIEAVGRDLVVGVRLSADDFQKGGVDLAASQQIARRLVDQTPIRFINVTHSTFSSPSIGFHMADMSYGPTPFIHLPLGIHEAVPDVPVFAVCRFTDLALAEQTLAGGRISMVGMARAHIADPHLIRKALEGREREILPCVALNRCHQQVENHQSITCMMNPTAGKETEWSVEVPKAGKRQRVLVVGGGPAGLEAARVAAERGHEVHLWESGSELGGQLRQGRLGHRRSDLDLLRRYHEAQHDRLGIDVRLGMQATLDAVLGLHPDAVVVATGGSSAAVPLEGWGRVEAAAEHLGDRDLSGKVVALIDLEGSWTIASAAETMAQAGAKVTVVSPLSTLLPGMGTMVRVTYVDRLGKLGVAWRLLRRPVRYRGRDLIIADTMNGTEETISGVDPIYVVAPPFANRALADELEGKVDRLFVIGDAEAPRSLLEAVFAGHRVSRSL